MRRRAHCSAPLPWSLGLAGLLALICALPSAQADEWGLDSFRDPFAAQDPAHQPAFELGGYFRLRGDLLRNLDLDRGPTPSTGQTLYPLPRSAPGDEDTLSSGNLRLRLEPVLRVGWEVTVHATLDCLDNVLLGGSPAASSSWAGMTAAATSQTPPPDSLQVRRAWAEVGTPVGLLMAGRMPVHWGLGLVANDGGCLDCDLGDTVDRVGLAMPLLGHIVGLSYDISSSGASQSLWGGVGQAVDVEPSDDVRSVSLGVLSMASPAVRRILLAGDRSVLDYGLAVSYRWQDLDAPGLEEGALPGPDDYVERGFAGLLLDGFFRWETQRNLLEAEVALLRGRLEDASLLPGMSTEAIESLQYGGLLRDQWRAQPWLRLGLELGFASGDPAPGFGARLDRDRDRARPGDLDGPQLDLPSDTRVDNFRFHPDARVDLILWREIIGTVTDAAYLKPSLLLGPAMGLELELAAVASWAIEASSTPGGERALGVELDCGLRYRSVDGFVAGLQYAVLLPGAGLDNPELGLEAQAAQRLHGILGVLF